MFFVIFYNFRLKTSYQKMELLNSSTTFDFTTFNLYLSAILNDNCTTELDLKKFRTDIRKYFMLNSDMQYMIKSFFFRDQYLNDFYKNTSLYDLIKYRESISLRQLHNNINYQHELNTYFTDSMIIALKNHKLSVYAFGNNGYMSNAAYNRVIEILKSHVGQYEMYVIDNSKTAEYKHNTAESILVSTDKYINIELVNDYESIQCYRAKLCCELKKIILIDNECEKTNFFESTICDIFNESINNLLNALPLAQRQNINIKHQINPSRIDTAFSLLSFYIDIYNDGIINYSSINENNRLHVNEAINTINELLKLIFFYASRETMFFYVTGPVDIENRKTFINISRHFSTKAISRKPTDHITYVENPICKFIFDPLRNQIFFNIMGPPIIFLILKETINNSIDDNFSFYYSNVNEMKEKKNRGNNCMSWIHQSMTMNCINNKLPNIENFLCHIVPNRGFFVLEKGMRAFMLISSNTIFEKVMYYQINSYTADNILTTLSRHYEKKLFNKYTCTHKVSIRRWNLSMYMSNHKPKVNIKTNRYTCDLCMCVYTRNNDLKRHKLTKHAGILDNTANVIHHNSSVSE
ncbi:MAG: zinc finger containing protein [Cotesia congregata filamentous virus 2]